MKVVYSTCPLWQNSASSLEELDAKVQEDITRVSMDSFREACNAIVSSKPLYEHPGYPSEVKAK